MVTAPRPARPDSAVQVSSTTLLRMRCILPTPCAIVNAGTPNAPVASSNVCAVRLAVGFSLKFVPHRKSVTTLRTANGRDFRVGRVEIRRRGRGASGFRSASPQDPLERPRVGQVRPTVCQKEKPAHMYSWAGSSLREPIGSSHLRMETGVLLENDDLLGRCRRPGHARRHRI
jgi:hypothetical protein